MLGKFILAAILGGLTATAAVAQELRPSVGVSPWGPADEIGALNMITDASRDAILGRISAGRAYDLSVDYFVGMPSWHGIGDPRYQYWLTHTPRGTAVDDPMKVGRQQNERVSYTGDAISLYTHMGTHIDALNHFGLNGAIYNGFRADEHLGDRGWRKAGAETIPPIVARGVLIDVASAKGLEMLPDNYRISRSDLQQALRRHGIDLRKGDVVLIRTGRMKLFEDEPAFMAQAPGLTVDAARFLVEEGGAISLGADNLSFEAFPSDVDGNYIPVHTYLLAQQGVTIMELVNLEELARDRVYEFAFVGASLKLRGASAAPLRPIAFPVRPERSESPGGRRR